jgi:hypothetical protein
LNVNWKPAQDLVPLDHLQAGEARSHDTHGFVDQGVGPGRRVKRFSRPFAGALGWRTCRQYSAQQIGIVRNAERH